MQKINSLRKEKSVVKFCQTLGRHKKKKSCYRIKTLGFNFIKLSQHEFINYLYLIKTISSLRHPLTNHSNINLLGKRTYPWALRIM